MVVTLVPQIFDRNDLATEAGKGPDECTSLVSPAGRTSIHFAVLLRVGRKRRAVLRLAHPFLALLHLDRPKSHRHSLTADAGKGPDEWNPLVSTAG